MNKLPEWFLSKVALNTDNGCWEWVGTIWKHGGYARICRPRTVPHTRGHRFAYEAAYGPIPDGLVIDHLCRNHRCVNPEHLEAVTDRVNALRGVGIASINARKAYCSKGHEFVPENTYYYGPTKRQRGCRECARLRQSPKTRRPRLSEAVLAMADADLLAGMSLSQAVKKYGYSASGWCRRRKVARQIHGIPCVK